MADTMIERVALALENELRRQHEEEGLDRWFPRGPGSEWLMVDGNVYVTPLIRAVIAAMREPTESMLTEKVLFSGFCHDADGMEDNDYHDRDDAKEIWQAMIDAALAEEG